MQSEKLSFRVGDWVVIKGSFVQKILKMSGGKNGEYLKQFKKPQKIQGIYREGTRLNREVIEFSPDEKWTLGGNEFRLATEREIKEHKIRSIFLYKK